MIDLSKITDEDLPPINRKWANIWEKEYCKAMLELAKANKGIRRLQRHNASLRDLCDRLQAALIVKESNYQTDPHCHKDLNPKLK